ncbi:phosphoprotein [Wuhan Insect virus 4]|uniref:Phosphoprotein n=1 Tax=Wuhan Insect virus 4 TaxID=1608109 RepID=A0A0B5KK90_9RHAB|nr:phosphoprotein [Wuhan Insect virus 4]AJG39175.1 phosphoprotein [Wuhan Insect virus 4]
MAKSQGFDDLAFGMSPHHNPFNDDADSDEYNDNVTQVPSPTVEDSDAADPSDYQSKKDIDQIILDLNESCAELGVQTDSEMINAVLAMSESYTMDSFSLRWFAFGMTYANNQRIIPQLSGVLGDLRAEIKALQQTNSSISKTSSDITKKMVSVKNDVLDGFEKLRANVLDKVVETSAHIMARDENKEATTQNSPSIYPKKDKIELAGPTTIADSQSVVMSSSPIFNDPVEPKMVNPLLKEKRNLLIESGADKKKLRELTDDEIELLVIDEELELSQDPTKQESADQLMAVLMSRLLDMDLM